MRRIERRGNQLVARQSREWNAFKPHGLGTIVHLAEVVAPLAGGKLHRLRVVRRQHRRDEPAVPEHELLHRTVEALVRELVLHRPHDRLARLGGVAGRLEDVGREETEGPVPVKR